MNSRQFVINTFRCRHAHMWYSLGVLLIANDIQGCVLEDYGGTSLSAQLRAQDCSINTRYKPSVRACETLETASPVAAANSGGSSETRGQ